MTKNEFLLTLVLDVVGDGISNTSLEDIIDNGKHFDALSEFYDTSCLDELERIEEGTHEERMIWERWGETISQVVSDVQSLVGNMKDSFGEAPKNGWFFMQKPRKKTVYLVQEFFWNQCGHLDDDCATNLRHDGIVLGCDWGEVCESEYQHKMGSQKDYEEGLKKLQAMGFTEVENPFDDDDDYDDEDYDPDAVLIAMGR